MCKINGKKLSEIRMEKGLSREELATKIGMSKSSIEKYETGAANPSDKVVDKICLLLKINKNDIEVADVGYSFTQGISRTVNNTRQKKRICPLFNTTADRGIYTGSFKCGRINGNKRGRLCIKELFQYCFKAIYSY